MYAHLDLILVFIAILMTVLPVKLDFIWSWVNVQFVTVNTLIANNAVQLTVLCVLMGFTCKIKFVNNAVQSSLVVIFVILQVVTHVLQDFFYKMVYV